MMDDADFNKLEQKLISIDSSIQHAITSNAPFPSSTITIELLSSLLNVITVMQATLTSGHHRNHDLEATIKAIAVINERLVSAVTTIFNSEHSALLVSQVWRNVFAPTYTSDGHSLPSTAAYQRICIYQLYSSYRVIHNYFGNHNMEWFISFTSFKQSLINALPLELVKPFILLYNDFSVDTKQSVFTRICSDGSFGDFIARLSSSDDTLDICSNLLRFVSSSNIAVDTAIVCSTVRQLAQRAVTAYNIRTITTELLLKKPYPFMYCQAVIQALPNRRAIVESIEIIAALWGHQETISRGNRAMQEHLTNLLLYSLSQVTSADLTDESDANKLPIMFTLSSGVSKYLDLPDSTTRKCGLKVATVYGRLLGQELKFDELTDIDLKFDGLGLDQSVTTSISSNPKDIAKTQKSPGDGKPLNSTATTRLYESSSDDEANSDSELEAFEIKEPSATPKSSNYLRHCLELLLCSETKAEAYESYRTAMISIPKIVLSNPWDARDVCPALIKALICLPNCFEMEDFDRLKSEALQPLLTTYPELTFPATVALIEATGSLSLGARLITITELIKAAHALAGLLPTSVSNQGENHSRQQSELVTAAPHSEDAKTHIKRPGMLAARNKKTRYFHNRFTAVANVAYFPLLHLLATSIPSTSSQSISLSGGLKLATGSFTDKEQYSMEDDGTDYLLPAKVLQAVAEFTRCSVNTTFQRTFLENTIKVAATFRDSHSLTMRRVAVEALYICVESYFQQKLRSSAAYERLAIDAGRPLAQLMNIAGLNTTVDSVTRDAIDEAVVATIDWAAQSLTIDPDLSCRAMKLEIIRLGVDGFEEKTNR